jgi:period circadian protein 2
MLRRYRGLNSSGYGVRNIDVVYEAFKLSLTFRETPADNSSNIFLEQQSGNF